ncbi:MAG: RNA polymerase sigma factor [Parcubacteria group bacterium]
MYAREVRTDTAARQALDERYRAPLMAFFLRRLSDRAEAEDLVQEVFVRMVARGASDDIRSADAFVFAIAGNLLRDRARLQATRSASAHTSLDPADDAPDENLVEHSTPDRVLLGRERLTLVQRALTELPERTRNIFVLYRMENMRRRDIAMLYGITVSAVEKHIAKALDHLMARLER